MKRSTLVVAVLFSSLLFSRLAMAGDPTTPDGWYEVGQTQFTLGNFDKAVEAFKKGFEMEPDDSKKPAYLYNIARGAVVDQAALVDALRSGQLAGAGLDVFEHEPLPEDSPLWDLDNVILTPHVAGLTPHYFERAAALFAENVDRFLSGQPLRNVYDPARGY